MTYVHRALNYWTNSIQIIIIWVIKIIKNNTNKQLDMNFFEVTFSHTGHFWSSLRMISSHLRQCADEM